MNTIVELRGNEATLSAQNQSQRKAAKALVLESPAQRPTMMWRAFHPASLSWIGCWGAVCPVALVPWWVASRASGNQRCWRRRRLVGPSGRVCYATAEESMAQVRARPALGIADAAVDLTATTDAEAIAGLLREGKHQAVVVDSIQTVAVNDLDGAAGTVSQVRGRRDVVEAAREGNCGLVLVGQVTKEGNPIKCDCSSTWWMR